MSEKVIGPVRKMGTEGRSGGDALSANSIMSLGAG